MPFSTAVEDEVLLNTTVRLLLDESEGCNDAGHCCSEDFRSSFGGAHPSAVNATNARLRANIVA
jgi:hypothetical protein